LLVVGSKAGKTLVVTAGIHGDEFEGVRAILDTYALLDPTVMTGTMIAVPVANPPAFWSGTRVSPLDNKNLARVFPGRENGTPTDVVAFHLGHAVIARADFYLDLHSAGVKLLMPTMVGYDASDARSYEAALIFGSPVIWGHPSIEPGRTISFAASQNIPSLYTEARGAGRIDPQDLEMFKNGIINLLRHLNILPGTPSCGTVRHRLFGDGNIDSCIPATKCGFLVPAVELLECVEAGQELGRTIDLHGQTVELFHAQRDGIVAMIHVFPVVRPGDMLFLVSDQGNP
jgi:predicted deacylase